MDLLRFDALVNSVDRVTTIEQINKAWLNFASAQATIKGMKAILKPLEQRINKTISGGISQSAADFISRLKKGFK